MERSKNSAAIKEKEENGNEKEEIEETKKINICDDENNDDDDVENDDDDDDDFDDDYDDDVINLSCDNDPRRKTLHSNYVGVSFNKNLNKFRACVLHNSKRHDLGRFQLAVDAARAYDKGVRDLKGEGWRINFQDDGEYAIAKAKEIAETKENAKDWGEDASLDEVRKAKEEVEDKRKKLENAMELMENISVVERGVITSNSMMSSMATAIPLKQSQPSNLLATRPCTVEAVNLHHPSTSAATLIRSKKEFTRGETKIPDGDPSTSTITSPPFHTNASPTIVSATVTSQNPENASAYHTNMHTPSHSTGPTPLLGQYKSPYNHHHYPPNPYYYTPYYHNPYYYNQYYASQQAALMQHHQQQHQQHQQQHQQRQKHIVTESSTVTPASKIGNRISSINMDKITRPAHCTTPVATPNPTVAATIRRRPPRRRKVKCGVLLPAIDLPPTNNFSSYWSFFQSQNHYLLPYRFPFLDSGSTSIQTYASKSQEKGAVITIDCVTDSIDDDDVDVQKIEVSAARRYESNFIRLLNSWTKQQQQVLHPCTISEYSSLKEKKREGEKLRRRQKQSSSKMKKEPGDGAASSSSSNSAEMTAMSTATKTPPSKKRPHPERTTSPPHEVRRSKRLCLISVSRASSKPSSSSSKRSNPKTSTPSNAPSSSTRLHTLPYLSFTKCSNLSRISFEDAIRLKSGDEGVVLLRQGSWLFNIIMKHLLLGAKTKTPTFIKGYQHLFLRQAKYYIQLPFQVLNTNGPKLLCPNNSLADKKLYIRGEGMTITFLGKIPKGCQEGYFMQWNSFFIDTRKKNGNKRNGVSEAKAKSCRGIDRDQAALELYGVRGCTSAPKSFDEPLKSLCSSLSRSLSENNSKRANNKNPLLKCRDLCMAARHILEVEVGDFDDYHLAQLSSDFYRILYHMEKSNHDDTLESLTKSCVENEVVTKSLQEAIGVSQNHSSDSAHCHPFSNSKEDIYSNSPKHVVDSLPTLPQKKKSQQKKSTNPLASASDPTKSKKIYSAYVGVTYTMSYSKLQFHSCITHRQKQHYLGEYKLPADAARAYDKTAKELKGYGCKLNFQTDKEYEQAKAKEAALYGMQEEDRKKENMVCMDSTAKSEEEGEKDTAGVTVEDSVTICFCLC